MKTTVSTNEFLKRFPNEESARLHIEQLRWHDGIVCPTCNKGGRIQKRVIVGYYRCLSCKKDFTVRTGTIFERSHVHLDKWLYAMYLIATSRKGISSMQLSKELGVTQKTAWFLLQRLRAANMSTFVSRDWVQRLSRELFWDVHQNRVTGTEHLKWLIERVLIYGRARDWSLLISNVPKARIAGISPHLRIPERERIFLNNYLETPRVTH